MSDVFILPIEPYGDVTVVIGPQDGAMALGARQPLRRLENALPQLSDVVLKVAKGFHDTVVRPLLDDQMAAAPTEITVEFSLNFSIEGGAFLQIGAESGLNVTLVWK